MTSEGRQRRTATALFVLAFGVRLLHAWRVPVPSTDGPHYLDMAERFAAGQWAEGFACIFHPGAALVLAPGIVLGADSFLVAKVVGALLGGLSALLLWQAGRALAPGGRAWLVGLLFSLSFLAVRLPADAYSESLYIVLASGTVLAALRGRAVIAGVAMGAAFWVRPEALCLLPLVCRRRRFGPLAIALLAAAGYPLLRSLLLGRFELTPKLAFMQPMGPLGEAGVTATAAHVLRNGLALARDGLPALDWVGLPLGIAGLVLLGRRQRATAGRLFLALGLGWLAMVLFQVKPRFFLSQVPLLLPPIALVVSRRRLAYAGLVLVACGVAAVRVTGDVITPPRTEKLAEAVLGRHLRQQGVAVGELVTDLPRVAFHAGLHPPPPGIFTPETLEPLLARPSVRWVVLGAAREGRVDLMARQAATFTVRALPSDVARLPGAERLALWERRTQK